VRILKVKNLVLKKKREYEREKRDIHKELYIDGRVLSIKHVGLLTSYNPIWCTHGLVPFSKPRGANQSNLTLLTGYGISFSEIYL
jgi:hypothetical protein